MKTKIFAAIITAFAMSLSFTPAAFACDCVGEDPQEPEPEPEPTSKGNNGFGQEKRGLPQDGENKGSDKGKGVPGGGPGAGIAGEDSKQDGTGLR